MNIKIEDLDKFLDSAGFVLTTEAKATLLQEVENIFNDSLVQCEKCNNWIDYNDRGFSEEEDDWVDCCESCIDEYDQDRREENPAEMTNQERGIK